MSGHVATAASKENVVICSGDCVVTLLPEFGGKIASIRVKGRELLQAPLTPIAARSRTLSFDASDASGWDECLPSVATCRVDTETGPVSISDPIRDPIPDHGDLWRVPWSVVGDRGAETEASVTLRGECFSLPLALERTSALTQTREGGWRLSLDYVLTNTGHDAVPWSWAAHALFAVEEGDRIELPGSIVDLRLEGSGGNRLRGDRPVAWPEAELTAGGTTNLSVVQGIDSEIGDKLFAGPLQAEENWCVLHRPAAGVRIRVSFDAAATPYLGLWICSGGWPDRAGLKQMCVAPEPSTAPVDSLAVQGNWSRVLGPGESTSWPVRVDFELL